MPTPCLVFLHGFWGWNSGSCAHKTSDFLTKPLPRPDSALTLLVRTADRPSRGEHASDKEKGPEVKISICEEGQPASLDPEGRTAAHQMPQNGVLCKFSGSYLLVVKVC